MGTSLRELNRMAACDTLAKLTESVTRLSDEERFPLRIELGPESEGAKALRDSVVGGYWQRALEHAIELWALAPSEEPLDVRPVVHALEALINATRSLSMFGIADGQLRGLIDIARSMCCVVWQKGMEAAVSLGRDPAPFLREMRLHTTETLVEAEVATHQLFAALVGKSKPKRRRRKASTVKMEKPVTEVENRTIHIVAKHGGNVSAAAAELGKNPKTVRENWNRGMRKLRAIAGAGSRSVGASRLPLDRRGQDTIQHGQGGD